MSEIMISKGFRYYYLTLSIYERQIYKSLETGIVRLQREISILPIDMKRAEQIVQYIRLDIPEFFFIQTTQMHVYKSCVISIIYEYRFEYADIVKMLDASEMIVEGLIEKCYRMSDYDKVKGIHDYLIAKCRYKDPEAPYSHEMPGALLYGRSVCDGTAKAFKFVADRMNLKSVCVYGELIRRNELHAWNKVQIDGNFTNIDVTFDQGISLDNHFRYDYFGLDDMELTDRKREDIHPVALKRYSYYMHENLFASGKSILQCLLRNRLHVDEWLSFQIPRMDDVSDSQMQKTLNRIVQTECERWIPNYALEYIPNQERGVYSIRVKPIARL